VKISRLSYFLVCLPFSLTAAPPTVDQAVQAELSTPRIPTPDPTKIWSTTCASSSTYLCTPPNAWMLGIGAPQGAIVPLADETAPPPEDTGFNYNF
jgi:hypothetical protein